MRTKNLKLLLLKSVLTACIVSLCVFNASAVQTTPGSANNVQFGAGTVTFRCGSGDICAIYDSNDGHLVLFNHGTPNDLGIGWLPGVIIGTGTDEEGTYTDYESEQIGMTISTPNKYKELAANNQSTPAIAPSDWEFKAVN